MDLNTLMNNLQGIVSSEYSSEDHTFRLSINTVSSLSPIDIILTKQNFPNHTELEFLDESVQIYEDVSVVLKDRKELKLNGWVESENKKRLISKNSRFFIGGFKRKMLGNVYTGKIGITKDFEPYVFINKYRFTPKEIKCIIKNETLKLSSSDKDVTIDLKQGRFTFNAANKKLSLPASSFTTGEHLNDLLFFLKKAKLI